MKLSAIKVDSATIEHGAAVDDIPGLPGVTLKVRGEGNADWRRLQAELGAAVPREKRKGGRLDQAVAEEITVRLLADAGLLGWSGIEDEAGAPIPYAKTTAEEWLADPDMRRFRDGVFWACTQVGERSAADLETDAKN